MLTGKLNGEYKEMDLSAFLIKYKCEAFQEDASAPFVCQLEIVVVNSPQEVIVFITETHSHLLYTPNDHAVAVCFLYNWRQCCILIS